MSSEAPIPRLGRVYFFKPVSTRQGGWGRSLWTAPSNADDAAIRHRPFDETLGWGLPPVDPSHPADTYMQGSIDAGEAMIKTAGNGSLLGDPYWFPASAKFGIGFHFSTASGGMTMRGVSSECMNVGPVGGRRRLDGDRVAPNGDNLDWSF